MTRYLPVLALCACGTTEVIEDTTDTAPMERCEALGLAKHDFVAGDGAFNGTAADATLTLHTGLTWSISTDWSGCDSLVFILSEPRQNSSFDVDLWAADHAALLDNSPDNVHYFFVPNDGQNAESRLNTVRGAMNTLLSTRGEAEILDWQDRLHYVNQTPSEIGGWLGGLLTNPGWGVIMGPDQSIRYVGSYADPTRYDGGVGWFAPNLSMAANEAVYANFQVEREERLAAEDVDEIVLFDGDRVQGSGYTTVTLPDAATMEAYDTLEYDLTMECEGDGEFGDCPAWDYLVYMYQCDDAAEAVDSLASTACQQAVPEVMGYCHADGTATATECADVTACEDNTGTSWACVGYQAAIDAETRTGSCTNPMGAGTDGAFTCNSDGTGFEDLSCPCGTETGRWITTYHREGRWVHDATPFLALMKEGGSKTFRFWTSQPYELDLSFRMSNRNVGHRPTEMTFLFSGAYYNPTVNDNWDPIDVPVPAGAKHVELAAIVSGHGGGQLNCGEFCHTTNHFFVGSSEYVVEDDWVDVQDGCQQQVAQGTVPNQYGTWWYGRNGWCPGKEVEVTRFDITGDATPGSNLTFDHETYGPNGMDLNGGGGERIEVDSWMVVYE